MALAAFTKTWLASGSLTVLALVRWSSLCDPCGFLHRTHEHWIDRLIYCPFKCGRWLLKVHLTFLAPMAQGIVVRSEWDMFNPLKINIVSASPLFFSESLSHLVPGALKDRLLTITHSLFPLERRTAAEQRLLKWRFYCYETQLPVESEWKLVLRLWWYLLIVVIV